MNLRRNPSSPQLRRSGSVALLGSSRSRGSSQSARPPQEPECQPQNERAPSKEALAIAEVELHEVCAICLEPLADDICFTFPCGFHHRLHYPCALVFLSSSLSFLHAAADGTIRRPVTEGLGQGLRAICAIGATLKRTPTEALKRLCCPLCRRSWPADDDVPIDSLMDQLGELRALTLRDAAEKMMEALAGAQNHLEHGPDAVYARTVKGFITLDTILHRPATFFAAHNWKESLMVTILKFLRCSSVQKLCAVSTMLRRICYNGNKLRVPYVSVCKVRTAMHHVSASDVRGLDAVASMSDSCMTALDVLTCTKWLSTCSAMTMLVLVGLKWQQIDPGGVHLSNCLADKALRILDLSNNYLMDDSLRCLAQALMKRQSADWGTLEVVNLNLNSATEVGLAAVLPLGSRPGGVKTWGFRHNKLGDAGCLAINKALFTKHIGCHVSGTSWDLRTNCITAKGAESLLAVFPFMTVARLGCNPLGDSGAQALAQGLGQFIVILDLGQAGIGDAGATIISRKLMNCSMLQELLLGGNDIQAAGATNLAGGWSWVTNLRFVDLACNPLGSCGVQGIAEELPFWTQTPFRLCLAGVECDDAGGLCLVRAIDKNPRRDWKWTIELHNNTCAKHAYDIRRLLDPGEPQMLPLNADLGNVRQSPKMMLPCAPNAERGKDSGSFKGSRMLAFSRSAAAIPA